MLKLGRSIIPQALIMKCENNNKGRKINNNKGLYFKYKSLLPKTGIFSISTMQKLTKEDFRFSLN